MDGVAMSKLVLAQQQFAQDVARLIQHAKEHGLDVTLGEAWRPAEMQELYIQQGKSWTRNSRHLSRLAIDLNLFRGEIYLQDEEEYAKLGLWWEASRPGINVWGASSGRPRKDANHFERKAGT